MKVGSKLKKRKRNKIRKYVEKKQVYGRGVIYFPMDEKGERNQIITLEIIKEREKLKAKALNK